MTTNNKANKTRNKTPKWLPYAIAGVVLFGMIIAAVLALGMMMKPLVPTEIITLEPSAVPIETIEVQATATQPVSYEDPQPRDVDGMEMVVVPAGAFQMGSNDVQLENARPVHTVLLDSFLIDKFEVTNAQFTAFLNQTEEHATDRAPWYGNAESGIRVEEVDGNWQPMAGFEQHPIVSVSWSGAAAYCAFVGGRLPTEAEWEKAARGADGNLYPWGNQFEECTYANSYGCAVDTMPVGSYPAGASPYGALDMAGNVFEWTADWYDSQYYTNSPAENPTGPETGTDRVIRGGSYYTYETDLRTAFRLFSNPHSAARYTGFRCVMDIEQP